MKILESRSSYFFEMGIEQYDKYSKEIITRNKDLMLCLGYMFEQSIELILKQISFDCIGSYPEIHRLYIIIQNIKENLNESELRAKRELIRLLENVESNARIYNNLSYAAKYEPDVKFNIRQLEELVELNSRLLIWYAKHGIDNEKYKEY